MYLYVVNLSATIFAAFGVVEYFCITNSLTISPLLFFNVPLIIPLAQVVKSNAAPLDSLSSHSLISSAVSVACAAVPPAVIFKVFAGTLTFLFAVASVPFALSVPFSSNVNSSSLSKAFFSSNFNFTSVSFPLFTYG